ncbi:leucine-rich repeat domain-containing protein [Treponema sp. OMZ 788]|uniref:leucine-rich repeat domain-containing protein n=1 Tax=Treponema sp. OMZ 788 TaxID=2563664 RepID=UPI0020A574D8|nr:leucine-rich repeat domain-containing protein [Treponema sp. OMZ 788]UTC64724.1 leucine-rich repeat domain-containing protein [Treponema sp. OMZ 788]
MKTNNSKTKAKAFLGAAFMLLIALIFTACPQKVKPKAEEPPAPPKHAVNFSVAGTGGTLKAEGDGITQPATSPITVEHGKEVIFTAKANDGYRVKGWTLDGNAVNGTAETYTLAVTQPATVKVSFELIPQAILTLAPNNLTIEVKAKTEDGSDITVEGCTETTLASEAKTKLTAKGATVILKGKITELSCYNNQLTALDVQGLTSLQKLDCGNNKLPELNVQGLTSLQSLSCRRNQLTALDVQGLTALQYLDCSNNKLPELNVQGLTALQKLYCIGNQLSVLNVQGLTALKKLECYINQLNAQAMTEILKALPAREAGDNAEAILYTEETNEPEGNCKDYTQPEDLKKAFDDAKGRNWKLQKLSESWEHVDI